MLRSSAMKLDADFRPYTVLRACNPQFTYQALQHEETFGTMLPCNVILQEKEPSRVKVSAADPVDSMQSTENPDLGQIAQDLIQMSALARVERCTSLQMWRAGFRSRAFAQIARPSQT